MKTQEQIEAILTAGNEAAIVADPIQDGGTCNFDTPTLILPRVRAAAVEAAGEATGIHVHRIQWMGSTAWWISTESLGQGSRRTTMAEAATRAMQAKIEELGRKDWSATTYYQMD